MTRLILGLGVAVMIAMCLVPPVYTGPVDAVSDVFEGEEGSRIEYHPLWTHPDVQGDGPVASLQNWEIAWTRLLLQLLGTGGLTVGLAYGLGRR
jgi:hypothetical protein